MEAEQIRKIYEAMNENGFNSIELELGEDHKIRMQLDRTPVLAAVAEEHLGAADHETGTLKTQVEIRSDKVGSFAFAERQLKVGDRIKKGDPWLDQGDQFPGSRQVLSRWHHCQRGS